MAPKCWPRPLPKARHSPSLAAATPWRPSINMALPTRSPTFPPVAARSSNSSKAKSCRRLKSWKAEPKAEADQEKEHSHDQVVGTGDRSGPVGRLRQHAERGAGTWKGAAGAEKKLLPSRLASRDHAGDQQAHGQRTAGEIRLCAQRSGTGLPLKGLIN